MRDSPVVVIGAGIAGLTAASLLANEGLNVTLIEAHSQPGGCAGTFSRGPFVFDVGATQVAGFESGGAHERVFRYLKLPLPAAQILDPACIVDLNDGLGAVTLWHDPEKWQHEINRQFPGSNAFWKLCKLIHKSNWEFMSRDPIVPPRSRWDFLQLISALTPLNITLAGLSVLSVDDLLKLTGCNKDPRLRKFLDLQLKLYSQDSADKTAAMYGSTVLQMAQAPLGLWHLQGSMQQLSDLLMTSLRRDEARVLLGHRADCLHFDDIKKQWSINVLNKEGSSIQFQASDVICSLPPQCLVNLIKGGSPVIDNYIQRIQKLPRPSGAVVFYGALRRTDLASDCPTHLQFNSENLGSIFISISQDGDGRAPSGQATLIASIFTKTDSWSNLSRSEYQRQKQIYLEIILDQIYIFLNLRTEDWLHKELATPHSFARWTGRPNGIVGGLGQRPIDFGLLGLPGRTPLQGLWLCGDSIHPGEGTAGVTQSALMICRQLLADRNQSLDI